jgi:hypothetical protein
MIVQDFYFTICGKRVLQNGRYGAPMLFQMTDVSTCAGLCSALAVKSKQVIESPKIVRDG